jgi:hypothetical protein
MKVAPNCSKIKGQINPQPTMSSSLSSSLSLSGGSTTRSQRTGSISSIPTSISTMATPYTSSAPNSALAAATSASDNGGGADLRSIYSYDAQNSDELSMTEGDLLHIIEQDDGTGWIKAQLGNHIGLIPANYVEYLDDTRPSIDAHLADEDVVYDDDAHMLDNPNVNNIPSAPPMTEFEIPSPPPPPQPVSTEIATAPMHETVVALYDFEAVNAEELNILQGDTIIVTKKDDSGWWEGTLNGQLGIFPANYVGSP